jgi:hypothetical protein
MIKYFKRNEELIKERNERKQGRKMRGSREGNMGRRGRIEKKLKIIFF